MNVVSLPGERTDAERGAMVESMEGAVKKHAADDRFFGREKDDVEQEIRVGLWKASATYDPRTGTKWSTFATDVVKTVVRRIAADAHRYHVPVTRFADGQEYVQPSREPEPLDALIEREEAAGLTDEDMRPFVALFTSAAIAGKLAKLDPPPRAVRPQRVETRPQMVRRLARAGRSVAEIEADMGLKNQCVRQCLGVPVRRHRPGYTAEGVPDEQLLADMLAAPPWKGDAPPKPPPAPKPPAGPKLGLRRLVEYLVLDGLSPGQVAERTGIPTKAIMRNLQIAIGKLNGSPFPRELTRKGRREAERAAIGLTDSPAAADRRRAKKTRADALAAKLAAAKARDANPAPEPAVAA